MSASGNKPEELTSPDEESRAKKQKIGSDNDSKNEKKDEKKEELKSEKKDESKNEKKDEDKDEKKKSKDKENSKKLNSALSNCDILEIKKILGDKNNPLLQKDIDRAFIASIENTKKSEKNAQIPDLIMPYISSINCVDKTGKTPLMAYSILGDSSKIKMCLEKGADINQQDKRGMTVLMNSIQFGLYNTAEYLMNFPQNFNLQNEWGDNALMLACTSKNNSEPNERIARILVEDKKIDVNQINRRNNTALHILLSPPTKHSSSAIQNISKIILPTNINLPNLLGETVLSKAVYLNDEKVVETVVKKNPDPAQKDVFGRSAISIAKRSNNENIISRLNTLLPSQNNANNQSKEEKKMSLKKNISFIYKVISSLICMQSRLIQQHY